MSAKGKAGDPPDVPKARDQRAGGREWLQSILSRFGPVKERASNTTVLDFEKPLVELDNRIKEVRHRRGQQGACGHQAATQTSQPCRSAASAAAAAGQRANPYHTLVLPTCLLPALRCGK